MEVASEFSYSRSDGTAVHMHQLTLSLTKDCSQGFGFCSLLVEPSSACRESFMTENCSACSRKWYVQRVHIGRLPTLLLRALILVGGGEQRSGDLITP